MNRPIGLEASVPATMHETKQQLIEVGLRLMLERGYHAIGIQEILDEADVPKGSFYHHFASKEDFALQVIDAYQRRVHELLDATLGNVRRLPLDRVRDFFSQVRDAYEQEGYLGCFLGALGQELSGANERFRRKIDDCMAAIAAAHAVCLEEARKRGDLPSTCDTRRAADLLVSAWEGAALRSRLQRSARPLDEILDFCLSAMAAR
jgi:TetR/AcrR family transcriptional regulator, transcriptional repressor for nem operon